jgi:E3 ubiquitin-protein ligase HUWE1
MFNPNYALFETSSSGNTYQPSSKSFINLDHLKYFKFIGRIVGKALAENENIDAFFTRSFYKLILGQDLELSDLEEQDYNFYKSMQYYRENKVEDELTFSYEREKFGTLETIDLVPNGRNIKVNEENKLDFIEKISLAKMRDDIQPQIKAFLEGFHELIPEDSIRFFDAKELELLISGLPNIDRNLLS